MMAVRGRKPSGADSPASPPPPLPLSDSVSGQATIVRDGKALGQWSPGKEESTELAEPEEGLPFIVRLGSGVPKPLRHSGVLRSKSGMQGVGRPEVRFQVADDADWLHVAVRGSMRHGGRFKEGVRVPGPWGIHPPCPAPPSRVLRP